MTRPRRVTLLIFFVLMIAVWNGIRIGEVLFFWKTLQAYSAQPGPFWSAFSAAFWLILSLTVSYGLWLGRPWSWYLAMAGTIGYPTWNWIDHWVIGGIPPNWLFSLVTTLLYIALILIILSTHKVTAFFHIRRKSNEPKQAPENHL